MNYKDSTGKTIEESFREFHQKHPEVFQYFCSYINDALAKGKKKVSAKTILGKIRWDIFMEKDDKQQFKINDAFSSRYARFYIIRFPHYKDIFNFRDLRS